MTKEEKVAYWLDIADYDMDTAKAMYDTGRWLYVGFMCHQVVEKVLKAYWSQMREDIPPYTHNHKQLAVGCGLYDVMTESQKDFIATIAAFNIQARYPEYKEQLLKVLNKSTCRDVIEQTNELQLWIRKRLSK